MLPKIVEKISKNQSGADLGPLIVGFLAFWSDAKKSRFFEACQNVQKVRKIGPRSAREPIQGERPEPQWWIIGSQGPQGGAFSRAVPTGKELTGLFEQEKGHKRDLTRPWPEARRIC